MPHPLENMKQLGGSIVPFARWGLRRDGGSDAISRIASAFGNRFFEAVEDVLEEDIGGKMSRIALHTTEAGFDPFGFDPETARYAMAVAALIHRRYFRTEVHGLGALPPGRLLIIANHSGQIPLDGMIIGCSLVLDADPPRFPRSMVEKWSATIPFVSVLFPRCGQVIGSPENARLLLNNNETIVVFPEGSRGISKTFRHRYQMTDFGLGFMRLALETNTPIVPVAVVGAEEQIVSVADFKSLAKLVGAPAFPIIPQMFLGAPFPLPTKYRLYFGDPLRFQGDPDDDDAVIEEKVAVVKGTIQSMINRGLKERKSIFW